MNRLCCLQLQDAVVCLALDCGHLLQWCARGSVDAHAQCQHRDQMFTSVQTAVAGLSS